MEKEFANIIAELERRNGKKGVSMHDAILVNTIKELRQLDALYESYEKELASNAHKVPFGLRKMVALKREEIRAMLKATGATITVDVSATAKVEPMVPPLGVAITKKSAINAIAVDLVRNYPFLMNFANYKDIAIYFATLYINYSDHDKRDLDIQLTPRFTDRIAWMIYTDGEVIDSGILAIDKDVPF